MPRLILQRTGRRKVPPCGRLIEYREPHSPFQKLIHSAMKRYGLSGRALAQKLGTARKELSQSTLWIWLHNTNGFPHPKSFTAWHLKRLSEVLKIPEIRIKRALDASRHLFTAKEDPMPHDAFDAFGRYIEILENDKRTTVSRSYVLNLAKNLYRGTAHSRRK